MPEQCTPPAAGVRATPSPTRRFLLPCESSNFLGSKLTGARLKEKFVHRVLTWRGVCAPRGAPGAGGLLAVGGTRVEKEHNLARAAPCSTQSGSSRAGTAHTYVRANAWRNEAQQQCDGLLRHGTRDPVGYHRGRRDMPAIGAPSMHCFCFRSTLDVSRGDFTTRRPAGPRVVRQLRQWTGRLGQGRQARRLGKHRGRGLNGCGATIHLRPRGWGAGG